MGGRVPQYYIWWWEEVNLDGPDSHHGCPISSTTSASIAWYGLHLEDEER